MTQSNRVQVAYVREATPGVTPGTPPRMRKARITGESLFYRPLYNQSDELRDDRMVDDATQIMFESGGGINFQFSYPVDDTFLSDVYRSAFYSAWTNTPQRDNDGTADSVITDVNSGSGVVTVTTGDAFVARHLVRNTGFTNSQNNGLFRCTTGSATVPAFASQGLVSESAPPAAARMKVIGLEGAEADLVAVSDGITSTSLNFTTMTGIAAGKWIKIGGTGATYRFATEANNGWARITAVAANKITLDNLPSGWTADTGEYASLRIFFGDQIKNGITQTTLTLERGFLGQNTPTYIVNRGMSANQLQMQIQNRQKIQGSVEFNGMDGGQSTTALDGSPDAVTTNRVMSAHVNVGRLAEGGSQIVSPNFARSFQFTINNNQRTVEDVTEDAPVGINDGECTVTGTIETYFGSNATLAKFFNGTITSFNARVEKDNQAVIWQLPRVTLSGGGNPSAQGKNQDVMASFEMSASKDTDVTNAHICCDRLEYYQA